MLKNIENGGKKESCVHGKKKSLALRLVEGASKQKLVPRVPIDMRTTLVGMAGLFVHF